jgi:hypothetical protein
VVDSRRPVILAALACDDKGWPIHGHFVWASPEWWERKFRDYGLVRDTAIEQAIHQNLAGFFKLATGRRCLFVLRRVANRRSSAAVVAAVRNALISSPRMPLCDPSDAQS